MKQQLAGLVLSGGGARGAYEVGILQGIIETLGTGRAKAPFSVIAGTSIGAINGAFLAANAHRNDFDITRLRELWLQLKLKDHLRVDVSAILGSFSPFRRLSRSMGDPYNLGRSLLDSKRIEKLVREEIDWNKLHENIASGRVHAFTIAALQVATGITTLFAELAPAAHFSFADSHRKVSRRELISAEHVLASASIPLLFPPRQLGRSYYVDGGLRFNTPIASAIHAGAEKLVVVSLRYERAPKPRTPEASANIENYPNPVFLAGKVIDALLLDPVAQDLGTLARVNELMDVIDSTLDESQRQVLAAKLRLLRGNAYQRISTLGFSPSQDVGELASEHLKERRGDWKVGRVYDALLSRASNGNGHWGADLSSYLMFDGSWTEILMSLGHSDALARADAIKEFFGSETAGASYKASTSLFQ